MATIKELVQKEIETFEKARKLKEAADNVAANITAQHEAAKRTESAR